MDKVYLQVYSFGMDCPLTLPEKLQKASEMGYAGVEFAGSDYGKLSADEMKALLKKYNLDAVSSHVHLDTFAKDLPYLAEIGAKYMIEPMAPFATKAEALELAAELNKFGKEAAKYGMKVGYHNHTMEFYKDEGKYLLDYLIENTDPENVVFELDCGWASAAGVNPVEYINKYAGRFVAVHVKENNAVIGAEKPRSSKDPMPKFELDENGKPIIPEEFKTAWAAREKLNVATGSGIVDWKAVKAAADAQGCKIYIVEREANYNNPPDRLACLQADVNYLKKNV